MDIKNINKGILGCVGTILLSSCTMAPKPFTSIQRVEQLQQNLKAVEVSRPKLDRRLSLHEAMARAIKYNLDYRVQVAEQVIANTDMQIANLTMLPNLVANAGFVDRNNVNAVLSPLTGLVSTAESRSRRLGDLSFSWNVLDFGVSYFESKQKGDQVLIANQKRRKMVQRLAKETRVSFWRALAAENYLANSRGFSSQIKDAINKSEIAEKDKVISPIESARYRRDLWTLYNQITSMQFELAKAKPQLMSLISSPSNSKVDLYVTSRERVDLPKNLPTSIGKLEKMALFKRPELEEENYRKRISINEIYKARVRILPGFETNLGPYYDSNAYLVNNDWNHLGLSLSWNIMRSLANLRGITLSQQQSILADIRRTALSVAIITQVDIAKLRYKMALYYVYTSRKALESERQIYDLLKKQEKVDIQNKLSLIKARAGLLFAELRYDIAHADKEEAAAELVDSVGMDPIYCLDNISMPLRDLTTMISKIMSDGPKQIPMYDQA